MTKDYYGTKRVTAWREDRQTGTSYAKDGIAITIQPGYSVKYEDGYTSWSPKDAFEAAYQPVDAMDFGRALQAMKDGHAVRRRGCEKRWPDGIEIVTGRASGEPLGFCLCGDGEDFTVRCNVNSDDILATDWQIVEAKQDEPELVGVDLGGTHHFGEALDCGILNTKGGQPFHSSDPVSYLGMTASEAMTEQAKRRERCASDRDLGRAMMNDGVACETDGAADRRDFEDDCAGESEPELSVFEVTVRLDAHHKPETHHIEASRYLVMPDGSLSLVDGNGMLTATYRDGYWVAVARLAQRDAA